MNTTQPQFYDDSILPGTKTTATKKDQAMMFYDDSILPGTKTQKMIVPDDTEVL